MEKRIASLRMAPAERQMSKESLQHSNSIGSFAAAAAAAASSNSPSGPPTESIDLCFNATRS